MLRQCSGLTAIALGLISATPAYSARTANSDSEAKEQISRKERRALSHDSIALSGIVRQRGDPDLLALRPADQTDLSFDEVPLGQRGMIGRLSLDERIDVGVGLFSVTGANLKERELKRTDPMRDVAPRTSRVAGAGLRLNF